MSGWEYKWMVSSMVKFHNKMSKSAEKMECIPVLGCSRTAPYTRADFSKDLQVYHLTSNHHPNQLYTGISENFMKSIEVQQDPANTYNNKMKNLYMEELDRSLNQYKHKMAQMNLENISFRKEYKENVNSMVLSMEREDIRRHQALTNCLRRQQLRGNRFVDADRIKNKKIDDFIQSNQYSNSLQLARSQLEQDYIRRSCNQEHQTPPLQTCQKKMISGKENSYQKGTNQTSSPKAANSVHLSYSKMSEPEIKFQEKSVELGKMSPQKIFRLHNPITNPIEYHIDNPYLITKMQKRQRS